MDADFTSSSRRIQLERERKLAQHRKKLEQERAESSLVEQAERARLEAKRERELQEARAREQEALDMASTGGVRYNQVLRAIPDTDLESNRITLPPSALHALTEQDALTSRPPVFELSLVDENGHILSQTCSGVREFTAEEGTVKLPVKTAMSLAKGRRLDAQSIVRVKYVVLDSHAKVVAKVQPLGAGFHLAGEETVNINLKQVLERALTSCMVLCEGDFIPLRHEGNTYTLVVRQLSPEPRETLLDTELELDLMPCEDVTLAQEREERAKAEAEQQRALARALLASLPPEPPEGVAVRLRLPSGAQATRRFARGGPLQPVLEWAAGLCVASPSLVELAQPLSSARPLDWADAGTVLGGSSQAFNVRVLPAPEPPGASPPRLPTPADSPWAQAARAAESSLDQRLSEEQQQEEEIDRDMTSSTDMFNLLVDEGADPPLAARACQKWLLSLRQLKASGLVQQQRGGRVVELLERFNGGVARVADALLAVEQGG